MILRAALAGAFALGIIFGVVWSVAQLPYGPGDLFISLFTTASPATTDALQEGVLYALLSGFVAGGLVRLGLLGFNFVELEFNGSRLDRERSGTGKSRVDDKSTK